MPRKRHPIPIIFKTISNLLQEEDVNKETANEVESLFKEIMVDYHSVPIQKLCLRYNTSERFGLTQKCAEEKLIEFGKNNIRPPKSTFLTKLLQSCLGGFSAVLWAASIISILAYKPLGGDNPDITNLALGILIIMVLCLHISFHIYQHYSSHKVMKSINTLIPSTVLVTRDQVQKIISTTELVEGDLVSLKLGIKIPADIRIIEGRDLKIDRSMLTGETEPVNCGPECTDDSYLDSYNIALTGTLVTNGEGKGIVVQTGDNSVMGKIAKLSSKAVDHDTLLMIEISRFVKIIATIAVSTAIFVIIIWASWLTVKYPTFLSLTDILINVISVLVAFVPTGLPVAVTLTLTIIARKMVSEKILIKNLNIVEALGSVHIIASDKTGTLTRNRMTVMSTVLDSSYELKECFDLYDQFHPQLMQFVAIAGLCNAATFDLTKLNLPISQRTIFGNATDAAFLRFSGRFKSKLELDEEFEKCFEIPFNSRNKWMLTVMKPKSEDNVFRTKDKIMMMKGAPDVLMPCCQYYLDENGEERPLDFDKKNFFKEQRKYWSKKGQRVILLARAIVPQEEEFSNYSINLEDEVPNLCIVGLCGIIDPPREGIRETLAQFKSAGIKIMMLTGDFSLTATAIAQQVGIFSNSNFDTIPNLRFDVRPEIEVCVHNEKSNVVSVKSILVNGPEIDGLSEEEWDKICQYDEIVFSRATPEHKLAVVQQFQKRDKRIAVTGDGVNDSPALRSADVGIAMGGGSSVAMEAAHMILLEDNFNSMLEAIRYGRLAFDNLKKVILYLLPAGSFSETIPILMNVLLGIPLPLSAFLMIIICVVTDVLSAMALMYEKPESDLLKRPPRDAKGDRLADEKLLLQAYCFIGIQEAFFANLIYFYYMMTAGKFHLSELILVFDKWTDGYKGYTMAQLEKMNHKGQTIFFVALVIMQCLGNLFATRTRRVSILQFNPFSRKNFNPYLIGAIFSSISIANIVVYVPFFNNLFNTRPIEPKYWFIPMIFALIILLSEELRKFIARKYPKSIIAKLSW